MACTESAGKQSGENCKNSLFRAQRENRHINAKDMSSMHPCVVVSARDEGTFVSCPSLL